MYGAYRKRPFTMPVFHLQGDINENSNIQFGEFIRCVNCTILNNESDLLTDGSAEITCPHQFLVDYILMGEGEGKSVYASHLAHLIHSAISLSQEA